MPMSGIYGKGDDATSISTVQHAIDHGINFLDSSDMYGWGQNEELLGKAIRGRRDKVLITTKFGQVRNPNGPNLVNGRPEYVAQACDASLQRLGVDVIDLYYQHRVDPSVPIEETVGGMARLVQQGKVRYLLSEAAPATIRRAHAVHPITALQNEYSLLYRNEAEQTLPLAASSASPSSPTHPRPRSPHREVPEPGRHSRGRPAARPSPFSGRQPRPERRAGAPHRGHRQGEAVHAGPARAGLAAGPGAGRRAHSGHQAAGAPGRERRRHGVRLEPRDVERIAAAVPAGAVAGCAIPRPR